MPIIMYSECEQQNKVTNSIDGECNVPPLDQPTTAPSVYIDFGTILITNFFFLKE